MGNNRQKTLSTIIKNNVQTSSKTWSNIVTNIVNNHQNTLSTIVKTRGQQSSKNMSIIILNMRMEELRSASPECQHHFQQPQ
jgi:hypothetical protein